MNKKIMMLVVLLLLIVLGVGAFVIMNNRDTNQNNANSNQNENENTIVDDNQTETEENGDEVVTTGKALVLYFTQSGNTETVAKVIASAVDGDLLRLETIKNYSSNYNDLVNEAQVEQRNQDRPEIATDLSILENYDTIFLGYPNWWGDMPMPIYSFLDNYDLSGKTIAPFITHGGSGLSGTPAKIKNLEPNATVTDGLAVRSSSVDNAESSVNSWLTQIGY